MNKKQLDDLFRQISQKASKWMQNQPAFKEIAEKTAKNGKTVFGPQLEKTIAKGIKNAAPTLLATQALGAIPGVQEIFGEFQDMMGEGTRKVMDATLGKIPGIGPLIVKVNSFAIDRLKDAAGVLGLRKFNHPDFWVAKENDLIDSYPRFKSRDWFNGLTSGTLTNTIMSVNLAQNLDFPKLISQNFKKFINAYHARIGSQPSAQLVDLQTFINNNAKLYSWLVCCNRFYHERLLDIRDCGMTDIPNGMSAGGCFLAGTAEEMGLSGISPVYKELTPSRTIQLHGRTASGMGYSVSDFPIGVYGSSDSRKVFNYGPTTWKNMTRKIANNLVCADNHIKYLEYLFDGHFLNNRKQGQRDFITLYPEFLMQECGGVKSCFDPSIVDDIIAENDTILAKDPAFGPFITAVGLKSQRNYILNGYEGYYDSEGTTPRFKDMDDSFRAALYNAQITMAMYNEQGTSLEPFDLTPRNDNLNAYVHIKKTVSNVELFKDTNKLNQYNTLERVAKSTLASACKFSTANYTLKLYNVCYAIPTDVKLIDYKLNFVLVSPDAVKWDSGFQLFTDEESLVSDCLGDMYFKIFLPEDNPGISPNISFVYAKDDLMCVRVPRTVYRNIIEECETYNLLGTDNVTDLVSSIDDLGDRFIYS